MSNARFSILQSKAVNDTKLSNAQFRTLAALGTFGDKDGWCFPKLKTLGAMLGKSKQAVSKDIQALVEFGYVEITPQYREDGSRKNNMYRLVFDTRQPHVDTPSTPEVDTPSTPEVDALTPHINAPVEVFKEKENGANIFNLYAELIGPLSNLISDDLAMYEKEMEHSWIVAAFKLAAERNIRNWSYIKKVLDNWKLKGPDWYPGKEREPIKPELRQREKVKIVLPDGTISEATT